MTETTLVAGVIQELEDMIKLIEAKKTHFALTGQTGLIQVADNVIKALKGLIEEFKQR